MTHQNLKQILIIIAYLAILTSCEPSPHQHSNKTYYESNYSPESLRKESNSSIEAKESKLTFGINQVENFPDLLASATKDYDDGIHKFIRKADIELMVESVTKTIISIENKVLKNEGFILNSEIKDNQYESQRENFSSDSVFIIYRGNPEATISIKIHHSKLDTLLREIAPLAKKIRYRRITAQDVTLDLLRYELKKNRLNKKQERISNAVNTKQGKLNDKAMIAEKELDRTIAYKDEAILAEYSINEQIEYSIVNITLYQNPFQYIEKTKKDQFENNKPNFFYLLQNSFINGWETLCICIISLINIWPILLVISFVIFIIYRKKTKK